MRIHSGETVVVIQADQQQESVVLELTPGQAAAFDRAARRRGVTPEVLLRELVLHALQQEQQRVRTWRRLDVLTGREREVAGLAGRGFTNHQIAEQLVISPETVKTHIRHILTKLSLNSKFDLRLLLDESRPASVGF